MESKVKSPSQKKTVKVDRRMRSLSLSIGNFIRYWGFRRIHGALWTQLYLSKTPLSCTDLSLRLGLSKALVSPALEELSQHQLILAAPGVDQKQKLYQAALDIEEVIKHVLKTRESKMLEQITSDFSAFSETAAQNQTIDLNRVNSLETMIFSARLMLEVLLSQKDLWNLPKELIP